MEKSLDIYSPFHLNKHLYDDRMSSLPDDVLLIILSSLTLKEMVKTSILSRRWLNLWVNTPVLDFHLDLAGCNNMVRNYFANWVNYVLQQHKGPYLKEFRTCCDIMSAYQDDIDGWLEFALARKVEILELNFLASGQSLCFHDRNYVFPNCWFSSGEANVDGCKSRVLLFNLKFLKSLSLKNVNVNDESVDIFLGNCPFLERLELVGSNRLVNLVISDPTLVLKYLRIEMCLGLQVLSISNINLVSLDTSFGDLILKDLPILVELSILGYANSLRRTLSQNATCLRQLESLKLGAFKFKLNWHEPERLSSREMSKIERLSFESLRHFEFKGYYGRDSDLELVMHVVKNAPGLEKIIIDTSNLTLRKMNYPEDSYEHEDGRWFAIRDMKRLRETKFIPPRVVVLIVS